MTISKGALAALVVGLGLAGALATGAVSSADPGRGANSSSVSGSGSGSGSRAVSESGSDSAALAEVLARKEARHAAELKEQAESVAGRESWPVGIFEDTEAPARGAKFVGTNRWVGSAAVDGSAGSGSAGSGSAASGSTLAVWAGRAGDDATRGRLLIGEFGADQQVVERQTVDLPGGGALRIVAAQGVVLDVVDASGRHHELNAATGTFR